MLPDRELSMKKVFITSGPDVDPNKILKNFWEDENPKHILTYTTSKYSVSLRFNYDTTRQIGIKM